MYQLSHESIFDSKCDLLVIPCNDKAGMTASVHKDIRQFGLPKWDEEIELGNVIFKETLGGYTNTFYVAYASSVDTNYNETNTEVIIQIMNKIREYVLSHSIKKINIPLLGTGAGRLSHETSFSIIKSYFPKDKDILLNICILDAEIFNSLQQAKNPPCVGKSEIMNPRVFISYTGANEKNKNWVKLLAGVLRNNGVDARIDIYCLQPGNDLPQWMTNEIILADKVLLICDKYYAQKADARGGGVGWETMIIQGDMLWQSNTTNKYIAIVREKGIDESLPIYVRSRYALHCHDEDAVPDTFIYDLLLAIFDRSIEPELGPIPGYILQAQKINHRK